MGTRPDPNWNRWVLQSVIDHYKTNVSDPNTVPFLVDGIDVRDEAWMNQPDRVELRVNGPDTKELSAGCWRLWVGVNIQFLSMMGQESKNRYDLETLVGLFMEYTDTPIPVYRLGTGVEDDATLIECLKPRRELSNAVRSVFFGQIDQDELMTQAQIDARYEMLIQV